MYIDGEKTREFAFNDETGKRSRRSHRARVLRCDALQQCVSHKLIDAA